MYNLDQTTEVLSPSITGSDTSPGFTTSEQSKPSITGIIKEAVKAPSHRKRENAPNLAGR